MGCWSKEQKVCASCRYWGGVRLIDFTASHFDTNSTGTCNGPFGSFRGLEMGDGSSCSEWEPYRL